MKDSGLRWETSVNPMWPISTLLKMVRVHVTSLGYLKKN